MPTIRQVWQLIQQGDFSFYLKDSYLDIPVANITNIFYILCGTTNLISGRFYHYELATAPRVLTSCTKVILFLCQHKSFHIIIIIIIIIII